MPLIPVDPDVEARVQRLELPFNRYGLDPYGVSRRHLCWFFSFLSWLYRDYFPVRAFGVENVPDRGRVIIVANHAGVLPYDAIYLMQSHGSGEVVVFPDDAPAAFREVLRRVAQMASELEPGADGEDEDENEGPLDDEGAAEPGAEASGDDAAPDGPDDDGRPRRGHLRLVD